MKHALPAILSFICPGLGQLIKGEIIKAILIFIFFWIGIHILILPGACVWLYGLYDAYNHNVQKEEIIMSTRCLKKEEAKGLMGETLK
jgi:TM2 domain-containing membrane protein YozV